MALAGEMRTAGINVDLAPVLDVNNNPANPVIGDRSFGDDAARVAECGVAFITAMQAAGVGGIMSAHVSFPAIEPSGLPATLSRSVMTTLLRDELGYDGLLFTDALEMGALGASGYAVPVAAIMALRAGADMLLFNSGEALHRQAHAAVEAAMRDGELLRARVAGALQRVEAAKLRFDIL